MLNSIQFTLLVCALIIQCSLTRAATIYVSTDGDDQQCIPGGSPCATINGAISIATDGDVIIVTPGTYIQSSPITFNGKSLTLQSQGIVIKSNSS